MKYPLLAVSEVLEKNRRTQPFNQFASYLQHPIAPKLGGDCLEMNKRLVGDLEDIEEIESIRVIRCSDILHVLTLFTFEDKVYVADPFAQHLHPIRLNTNPNRSTTGDAYPYNGDRKSKIYLDYIAEDKAFKLQKKRPNGKTSPIGIFYPFDPACSVTIHTYNPQERLGYKQARVFRISTPNGTNTTILLPEKFRSEQDLTIFDSDNSGETPFTMQDQFRAKLTRAAEQNDLDPEEIIEHIIEAIPIMRAKQQSSQSKSDI